MDQKRRRRLKILIRQGNDAGEVIFELSGNSPYSGVLTKIYGDGDWLETILIPAGSLRGLTLQPPVDQTLKISVIDGRFCVGTWSCAATSVEVT